MKPTTLEIWKRLDARLKNVRDKSFANKFSAARFVAIADCRNEILLELEKMDREQSLNETKP